MGSYYEYADEIHIRKVFPSWIVDVSFETVPCRENRMLSMDLIAKIQNL